MANKAIAFAQPQSQIAKIEECFFVHEICGPERYNLSRVTAGIHYAWNALLSAC